MTGSFYNVICLEAKLFDLQMSIRNASTLTSIMLRFTNIKYSECKSESSLI